MRFFALDLVAIVADKDAGEAIAALLSSRRESLGIRPIQFEIRHVPGKDSAVFRYSPDILRTFIHQAAYSLVVFDFHGCGQETRKSALDVREDVLRRLDLAGWNDRSDVIVLEPELETWVWSDSPRVREVLGWDDRDLRGWLRKKGLWHDGELKPAKPKEAMEQALREVGVSWSASLHRELAEKVGLNRCQAPSFLHLREALRHWFGVDDSKQP
jgi:hypothetical protein